MSKSYTKSNNKTMIKAFCKVCKDAGKPESIYTSHGIKNERGNVICPTLLEQSCRYCLKNGHTVKYCPTLAKNEKEDKKQTNKEIFNNNNKIASNKNNKTNKNKSIFAALCDETSSDEEKVIKKKETKKIIDEFPPLNNKNDKKNDKNVSISISFKNIISITNEQVRLKQEKKEEEEVFKRLNEKKYIKEQITIVEAPIPIVAPLKKRNWADVYSSDEEDEDEEDKEEQLPYNIKKSKFLATYNNPYDSD